MGTHRLSLGLVEHSGLAQTLATPRMTEESIKIDLGMIAKGRQLIAANDASSVVSIDMDFHTLIYDLSGNPIISDTMYLNWRHLQQRSMGHVHQFPGASSRVWNEHEAIFQAMVAGDTGVAVKTDARPNCRGAGARTGRLGPEHCHGSL